MEKIVLSESSDVFKHVQQEWREKAKTATIETLPAFLTELTQKYQHDYGTICHAVAIAAVAAAWAVDHSPSGGITGFQAGCIMWQFIREWNCSDNKTGMRLLNYDNFLYPQYADKFDKVLDKSVWEAIQKEAGKKIADADRQYEKYLADLDQYKKDIGAFVERFPDYYERREHYDPLGIGTGEQAPQKPYCLVNSTSPVYRHWVSIVGGCVPFGFVLAG